MTIIHEGIFFVILFGHKRDVQPYCLGHRVATQPHFSWDRARERENERSVESLPRHSSTSSSSCYIASCWERRAIERVRRKARHAQRTENVAVADAQSVGISTEPSLFSLSLDLSHPPSIYPSRSLHLSSSLHNALRLCCHISRPLSLSSSPPLASPNGFLPTSPTICVCLYKFLCMRLCDRALIQPQLPRLARREKYRFKYKYKNVAFPAFTVLFNNHAGPAAQRSLKRDDHFWK